MHILIHFNLGNGQKNYMITSILVLMKLNKRKLSYISDLNK